MSAVVRWANQRVRQTALRDSTAEWVRRRGEVAILLKVRGHSDTRGSGRIMFSYTTPRITADRLQCVNESDSVPNAVGPLPSAYRSPGAVQVKRPGGVCQFSGLMGCPSLPLNSGVWSFAALLSCCRCRFTPRARQET